MRDVVDLKQISDGYAIALGPLSKKYTETTKQLGRVNDPIPPAVHKMKVIEALIRAFKNELAALKEGTMDFMKDTGVMASDADGYSVSLKMKPQRVVITDEEELLRDYPDYFKPQPAKLDEPALRKLLQHKKLDCAHLADGGDTLQIRMNTRSS